MWGGYTIKHKFFKYLNAVRHLGMCVVFVHKITDISITIKTAAKTKEPTKATLI
jgi:hypothetical protein